MLTETPMGWVAIAAFLVGAIVRLMKTDGMKIALAKLDLPPIPTRALPWIALVLGGAGATLDAYLHGATWNAAAQAGVMAAALAVFGHELGSGVPGVKRMLGVAALVGTLGMAAACAVLKDVVPFLPSPSQDLCILEQIDKGEENPLVIGTRCGLGQNALEYVKHIVVGSKATKAARANAARATPTTPCAADAGVACSGGDAGSR